MDNRLATLLTRGSSLTRAEYRVLAHLTEHPLLVGNITVRELAQATFVSTATIMRLCQKLGFSGFSEFIWHCKQLLSDTPHITVQPEQHAEMPALYPVRCQLSADLPVGHSGQTPAVCQPAAPERELLLYGAGFSYLFAEYLTKKLQVLGKTAFISGAGQPEYFLSNAARYQVFIAVSRSGETEQVLDKARIAKNVGMTIVAFTRASANTLAGMADVHFALYDEAVHFAAEAAGVTSFESNLVLLMDLLLLEATG